MARKKKRLSPSVFDLPIHEMRRGYRSDIYFWRSKIILEEEGCNPSVRMQVFQKKEALLCGIDEALAILKVASGFYKDRQKAYEKFDRLMKVKEEIRKLYPTDSKSYLKKIREKVTIQNTLDRLWENRYEELEVKALFDGDPVDPHETVLTIDGPAGHFIHLETLYLGVLARRTRVATNVRRVVEAAGGRPILFFPARFDHWANQGGDGYAAKVGGASLVSTDAQASWWGAKGAGTVPHALIACYKGCTVKATEDFHKTYPNAACIALVDFHNDCVGTSLEVARALGEKLYGVRLDTSETMVDRSVQKDMGQFNPTGVCVELVENVRKSLDREGFQHVKIIVSGGFNASKIKSFEECGTSVDAYGVGSSLFSGSYDYTADIVKVEGGDCSKAGRKYKANKRLKRVPV